MTLQKSRMLRTLEGKETDTRPIWIMRQAGRYLPEFKELRRNHGSFMDLCRSPQGCCEATLMPLERFDLDAAIIFSDIMVIPDAMGGEVEFIEGRGPVCSQPFAVESKVNAFDSDSIKYVYDAIALTRKNLSSAIPLIGFAGSPWTLFTYVIHADFSSDRREVAKLIALRYPQWTHAVLQALTNAVIEHLQNQLAAGADIVQVFDSWAGVLSPRDYRNFSLPYLAQITKAMNDQGSKVMIYAKGANSVLSELADISPTALGLDWTIDLKQARKIVPGNIAIQGNVDPIFLNAEPELAYSATQKTLADYGDSTGHIVNLGHGITPQANIESVAAMIQAVRDFRL